MQWTHIDFDLKRWRLPETLTKNKDVNIILLTQVVLEILIRRKAKNLRLESPSLFVFPSNGKAGHLNDPKKSFERIRNRMGTSDIRIHDLRRTLASYMAISGASLPIIGKALNHKSQNSTAIYARLSLNPVSYAVDKAVEVMIGGNIASQFKENIGLCTAIAHIGSIRFGDLMAA